MAEMIDDDSVGDGEGEGEYREIEVREQDRYMHRTRRIEYSFN